FPSPAEDYIEKRLDFNEYLVQHPAATFCVRATGNSMRGAGIAPGDLLVIDRAITPVDGKIVIAAVNGELTVKRLRKKNGKVYLSPENPDYPSIEISAETGLEVWGVVTHVIHKAE
ncbi:MAG: LexA family protein, partial [Spirochaetota bacterium]